MGTPLVARVAEIVALARLRAAGGAAALLVGEAGVGKTAVVEEAVARAAGARGLIGRAAPDEGGPAFWPGRGGPAFWPWLRLLDPDLDGLSPALLRLADEGGPAASARFRAIRETIGA